MSYETKLYFFLLGWKPFFKAEKLQAVKLKQMSEAEVDRKGCFHVRG